MMPAKCRTLIDKQKNVCVIRSDASSLRLPHLDYGAAGARFLPTLGSLHHLAVRMTTRASFLQSKHAHLDETECLPPVLAS